MKNGGIGKKLIRIVILDKFHDELGGNVCILQDFQIFLPSVCTVGKGIALMGIVPCKYVNGAQIGKNERKVLFVIGERKGLPIGFDVFICAVGKKCDGGFSVIV